MHNPNQVGLNGHHRVAVMPSGDILLERPLPFNSDAERATLGAILLENSLLAEVAASLPVESIYSVSNRNIYRAMRALGDVGRPIDPIALADEMRRAGTLEESGGVAYITELWTVSVRFSNVDNYVRLITETATERELIRGGAEITAMAMDDDTPVAEKVAKAQAIIARIEDPTAKIQWRTAAELAYERMDAAEAFASSERTFSGLPTGLQRLDWIMDGMQKSDLIVIAARPSMGKSALTLCMALGACEQPDNDNPVIAYFTLENSKEQTIDRAIAIRARVDARKFRRGALIPEEWRRVAETQKWLDTRRLWIDDESAISPSQLRAKCRDLKRREKRLDLIVVDFLQSMRADEPSENLTRDITTVAQQLKKIAKNDFNVPLVAVASLNRGSESRADKRPLMSDLRESGQIESEADVIAMVYRDDYYNPDSPKQNIAEVNFVKNRNGPTGGAELVFLRQILRFEDPFEAR
jgi:replicative DNA helicase